MSIAARAAVSFPDSPACELHVAWPASRRSTPDRHLALEPPAEVVTLSDLGYRDAEIEPTATPVAASAPFRVLSDEGAAVMQRTARTLRARATRAGNRIENVVRKRLLPLPLASGTGDGGHGRHLRRRGRAAYHAGASRASELRAGERGRGRGQVAPRHHRPRLRDDGHRPGATSGGRFEYFLGTKGEAAALAAEGKTPPPDRVVAPDFPGPGYAIALHGNMVVHRGAPLTAQAERITMVNAYVALDRTRDDQSRSRDLIGIDDPAVLYTEWARHVAWRAQGRLAGLIDTLPFGQSPEAVASRLESAIEDVRQAIADMRAGPREAEHYER